MKRVQRLVLLAAILGTACAPGDAPEAAGSAPGAPANVVDSVFPMDVMLTRFRADIPEATAVSGGTETRDALVAGVVDALQNADTMAFESLALPLAEWAWLYYPTSAQAQPPYELPPGMAWLQLQQANRTGVLRALERLGGQSLGYQGYTCDPEPTVEGENRLWIGCLVTLVRSGEEPMAIRLFSSILERDGRFVVLSYANDF